MNEHNSILEVKKCNRPCDQSHEHALNDEVNGTFNLHDTGMIEHISIFELKRAVQNAKRNKACGLDGIPANVLKLVFDFIFTCFFFNLF